MLTIVMGVISMMGGLWGMWTWRYEFVYFLKGFVPISFVFAGLVAIVAGLSNWKDRG